MKLKIVNIGFVITLATLCHSAVASKDELPNGKPFQNLQEQVEATNSALDAANEARAAAVLALEAADDALRAKDELLQGQIDQINLTIVEEVARINNVIATLEQEISEVEAGSDEANALQDIIIERIGDAITSLRQRADAAEEANILQNAQIDLLWARAQAIETKSDADYVEARAKFLDLEQSISNALAAANSAYSLGGQAMAKANEAYALAISDADYNYLLSQLNTVRTTVNNLDNHLNAVCPTGYYVIGVNSYGALKCRTITDAVSVTQTLLESRYCIDDTIVGCIDYAYYQRGTAYCPSGYYRTGTTVFVPKGNDYYRSTYKVTYNSTSSTFKTHTYDSSFDNIGSVTVNCTKTYYERTVYGTN